MNSNYTLRFPRTSREAFGYSVKRSEFEGDRGDRFVAIVCAIGIAFVLGMAVGSGM
jgi:hypothetical protein